MNEIKRTILMLKNHNFIDIETGTVNDYVCKAIDALEKQIPKKVVSTCNGEILHCPGCDEDLMGCVDSDYVPSFGIQWCPYCGQALDWSVVKCQE